MDNDWPNRSLNDAVLDGFTDVGAIGVTFPYRARVGLPLTLQVRVLSGNSLDTMADVLDHAPYSLRMHSPCCNSDFAPPRRTKGGETRGNVCRKCRKTYDWASSRGIISILGAGRVDAITNLSNVIEAEYGTKPLEATLEAAAIIDEILAVHEEYLTPAWARDVAEQIELKRNSAGEASPVSALLQSIGAV